MRSRAPIVKFEYAGHEVSISGFREGEYLFNCIKENKLFYEHDLLELVFKIPLGEGSIIDIGANIGNHTLFFSLIMKRKTHAFEVSPELLAVLKRNVEMNRVSEGVTIHEYGLYSKSTRCLISVNYENMGKTHVSSVESDAEDAIELKRLDDVITEDENISLIKVDVEGVELEVLQGAITILSRCKPICLVEIHTSPKLELLAKYFFNQGYHPVCILGRSDTWLYVPEEKMDFIGRYIDAVQNRRREQTLLASQTRVKQIQYTVERELKNERLLKNRLNEERDKARKEAKAAENALASKTVQHDKTRKALASKTVQHDKTRKALASKTVQHDKTRKALASKTVQHDKVRKDLRAAQMVLSKRLSSRLKRKASFVARGIGRTLPFRSKRKITGKISRDPSPENPKQSNKLIELSGKPSYDSVVLCNSYPGGAREYGGEFIESRIEAYSNKGHKSLVVEISNRNNRARLDKAEEVGVLRIPPSDLKDYLNNVSGHIGPIIAHSPTPETLDILTEEIGQYRCFYWFHGYEVRDYRRLFFNYSTAELENNREKLDSINLRRIAAVRKCFTNKMSNKVFVSHYLKSIAERDVGDTVKNAHIIPNFINGGFYKFRRKTADHAKRILLIRAFKNRNYANDIAIEAIRILSERDGFRGLNFTICGFGPHFVPLTEKLEKFSNVTLREGHLSPSEMRDLHAEHGILLVPSRFDTQGVTMGEAMASGLVCITNNVTAIPEFADEACACLIRPDDPKAYAEAIWTLTKDPKKMSRISELAGERVRRQCGFNQTIKRELSLLNNINVGA